MPTFQIYNVTPILPAALEPLREMSFNLWWTWEPAARRLFRHLDPELWDRTNHNPVRMLQLSRQSRLEEVSQDKKFLRELKDVYDEFKKYLDRKHVLLPDVTKMVADQLKTLRTSEPRRAEKRERSKDDGESQGPMGESKAGGSGPSGPNAAPSSSK